jgi:hypothetical protein
MVPCECIIPVCKIQNLFVTLALANKLMTNCMFLYFVCGHKSVNTAQLSTKKFIKNLNLSDFELTSYRYRLEVNDCVSVVLRVLWIFLTFYSVPRNFPRAEVECSEYSQNLINRLIKVINIIHNRNLMKTVCKTMKQSKNIPKRLRFFKIILLLPVTIGKSAVPTITSVLTRI